MRPTLRNWLIALLVGLLVLIAGIAIAVSPLTKVVSYKATGEVLVTSPQWENLKALFAQTNVDLAQVRTLDSGGSLLVQFTDINVSQDFPYGKVVRTVRKDVNEPAVAFEILFCVIGGIAALVCTLGACSEYFNWS